MGTPPDDAVVFRMPGARDPGLVQKLRSLAEHEAKLDEGVRRLYAVVQAVVEKYREATEVDLSVSELSFSSEEFFWRVSFRDISLIAGDGQVHPKSSHEFTALCSIRGAQAAWQFYLLEADHPWQAIRDDHPVGSVTPGVVEDILSEGVDRILGERPATR